MEYRYGCRNSIGSFQPLFDFFVYKITLTNEDNKTVNLSWQQVKSRCRDIGIKHVPEFQWKDRYPTSCKKEADPGDTPFVRIFDSRNGGEQFVLDDCRKFAEGPSLLDPTHIREGVVVRVEHPDMFKTLKFKSSNFCLLEGIRTNDDLSIDPEDIN